MSTRDMIMEINPGYKKYDGFIVGHNLYLLGEYNGETSRYYGSSFDNSQGCGYLLLINETEQRWSADCEVTIEYEECELSPPDLINIRGANMERRSWQKISGTKTTTITIPKGTRTYHQFRRTNIIAHKITSIIPSDLTQKFKIYCVANDGVRIIDGFNAFEDIRTMIDKTERSVFISPPPCKLCDGTGIYNDDTCPDCNGYKFFGYNAESYFLNRKAEQYGIKKRDESDESYQWRAWASQWWILPVKERIKQYIAHFTKVDIDKIQIEEHFIPEAYWIVRLPIFSIGEQTVGDLLSYEDGTYEELFGDLSPAGTNVVIRGFFEFGDFDVFGEHGGVRDPSALDDYSRSNFGMNFWTGNPNDVRDGNFFLDGVGSAYSENEFDDGKPFYEGLTINAYRRFLEYDQPWVSGEEYV